MQNDKLRDILKFFRFHVAWFILSAGFFAVILISGFFFSNTYLSYQHPSPALNTVDMPNSPISAPLPAPSQPDSPSIPQAPESPSTPSSPTPQPILEVTSVEVEPPALVPVSVPKVESPSTTVSTMEYTVQRGDTLWSIALAFYNDGYSFSRISQANNIVNADRIVIGQKLIIPGLDTSSVDATVSAEAQVGQITDRAWSEDHTVYVDYTVEKGDTLWDIAEREWGDPFQWKELYQINKTVVGSNPDLIYPGTALRIPSS